jgi:2-C-methyl-D-erythritol 4-phosphate cytidylyltransferase
MDNTVAVLIPAAGMGERLGQGPKAFVPVAGRPLLAWSLAALDRFGEELVVALPQGWQVRAQALCEPWVDLRRVRWVEGGETRQATVQRLLAASAAPWVLIHDAARPFLDEATIRALLGAVQRTSAASAYQPLVDTLVRVDDGAPVDRAGLRAVQTPQAFERRLLLRAHAEGERRGYRATDDAGLVWCLGHPIEWVLGGSHLFKVTTPADLSLAEAVAANRRFGAAT